MAREDQAGEHGSALQDHSLSPTPYSTLVGTRIIVRPNKAPLSEIIAAPEIYRADKAQTGVILQKGLYVDEYWCLGDTVGFIAAAAAVIEYEGQELYLLDQHQLTGKITSAEDIASAQPRPGRLLVRRVKRGYVWQGLVKVPDRYASGVKNPNAIVWKLSPEVEEAAGGKIKVGDVVHVAPGVSRAMAFPEPRDYEGPWEYVVYDCSLHEIVGVVRQSEDKSDISEGFFENVSEARLHAEDRADETL